MTSLINALEGIINPEMSVGNDIIKGIESAVVWLGRQIQSGWKHYLLPAIRTIFNFFRTGHGLSLIVAAIGLALLYLLQKEHHADSILANKVVRVLINVGIVACLIGAGILFITGKAMLI